MNTVSYDYLFKKPLVGDPGTGKSSLIMRFVGGSNFNADIVTKIIEIDRKRTKLQIWDPVKQRRWPTLHSACYRRAHGIIIVYDVTNENSFNNVKLWLQEIKTKGIENATIVIVGNKCDLTTHRHVDFSAGKKFADKHEISFFETSATNLINVQESFFTVAKEAHEKRDISETSKVSLCQSLTLIKRLLAPIVPCSN